MSKGPAGVDPVDLVELRIERRRAQLLHDWEEARLDVARRNRWTPLAAVVAAAALGFGLARGRPAAPGSGPGARNTRGGILAAIAAILGGGLRFALSPTGRALWTSFRDARSGR